MMQARWKTRSTARRVVLGYKVAAALSLSAMSGCNLTTGETVVEYSVHLVVYGTVTDEGSQPVAGAAVYAKAHRNNECNDPSGLEGNGNTNAAGNYRIFLNSWGNTYTACVEARLDHFEESLNVPSQRPNVLIRQNSPLDSVRIDLVRSSAPPPSPLAQPSPFRQ